MNHVFCARFFPLFCVCAALLAACATSDPAPVVHHSSGNGGGAAAAVPPAAAQPGYHIVRKGDTLYSIALEYGQDYREIAAWNYLTDPHHIVIGQNLRVLPSAANASAGGVNTAPVSGAPVVQQRSLESAPIAVSADASGNAIKREPRGDKEPYSDARYAALRNVSAPAAAGAASQSAPAVVAPPPPATAPAPPAAAAAPTTASAGGVVWAWPSGGKVIGGFAQNKGLEISGKAGDPVLAAADGRVVYTGDSLRGYGNLVIIKHNATYLTAYAHNRKILVKEEQSVTRGAKIAEMGNSESDVVKLHFEVRKQGAPVDPLEYLPKK
ncbi:MAG: peptidoglycan DD-metalloendopeptidase family protein [Zoogloeaceae bacterium]|jgi:lipoprotein NlpD|nr:peptidoglycan DD-metalloendopeptidase family protein [Zoogloeaceae bacterium]